MTMRDEVSTLRSSVRARRGSPAKPSRRLVSSTNQLIAGAGQDRRALASIKPTDVLVLGIQSWPAGIVYSPLDVNGRAALYSSGVS